MPSTPKLCRLIGTQARRVLNKTGTAAAGKQPTLISGMMYITLSDKLSKNRFSGVIYTNDGKEFARISYCAESGTIEVKDKKDKFSTVVSGCPGKYSFYYNDEIFAHYIQKEYGEVDMLDPEGHLMWVLARDSYSRRLKWCYRQGYSLSAAHKYAAWGDIIYSAKCAITSIIPWNHWILQHDGRYPLLSGEDENNLLKLPKGEQFAIIVLCARYLCCIDTGTSALSSVPAGDLQNVASYTVYANNLCISPDVFSRRKAEKFILGAPAATTALYIISVLHAVVFFYWDFSDDLSLIKKFLLFIITYILVNGIPLGWLLLMKLGDRFLEPKHFFKTIEDNIEKMKYQKKSE